MIRDLLGDDDTVEQQRQNRRSSKRGQSARKSGLGNLPTAAVPSIRGGSMRSAAVGGAWLEGGSPFARLTRYCQELFIGSDKTLPDAWKMWLLFGCSVGYSDMSAVVFYTALIETSYECDLWTLWGEYFMISNIISFPLSLLCGWLSDWWSKYTHIVLFELGLLLSAVQIATLWIKNVWMLGVLFNLQSIFLLQLSVDRFKLLKARVTKHYGAQNLLDQDRESNRIAPLGDLFGAITATITYLAVWQGFRAKTRIGGEDGFHISRIIIYVVCTAYSIIIALVAMTYKQADLEVPPKEEPEEHDYEALGPYYTPNLWRRVLAPVLAFLKYCKKSILSIGTNAIALYSLALIAMIQLCYLLVVYPLSQTQATEYPTDAFPEAKCEGLMPNIYLQNFIANIGYIIGAFVYVLIFSRMNPFTFHSFAFPAVVVLLMDLTAIFFFTDDINVYVSATNLAVLTVVTYQMGGYFVALGMAAVDDAIFGFYNSMYSLVLAVASEVTAIVTADEVNVNALLWIAMAAFMMSLFISVVFAFHKKHELKETEGEF